MFGGLMGAIHHKVDNPMTNPIEKYSIFDAFGHLMAETKQQDQIEKKVILYSQQG